ncbi:hypothetical protein [Streptomyces sp. NPDC101149]|uniref:hypothetical protein n=1 Tax=Streptomyces sp. NPDC101149 TaxID=3366113 RepID=UPI0038223031
MITRARFVTRHTAVGSVEICSGGREVFESMVVVMPAKTSKLAAGSTAHGQFG